MTARRTKNKIVVFLAFTLAFSSIFYFLLITAGSLQAAGGPLVSWGLMWCPGLAALLTQFIFEKNVRDFGWGWGKTRYQVWGYFIPLFYALVAYGAVWMTGLCAVPNREFLDKVIARFGMGDSPAAAIAAYLLACATMGVGVSCLSALGEEIGWRGFLVPHLARLMSYPKVAVVSGLIWSSWHWPMIVFAEYANKGAPVWYGVVCFTAMVIGLSFGFTWLRLKSGNIWGVVLWHASHNVFVQRFFTPLTSDTPWTPYLVDEFGAALAIVVALVALAFWSRRSEVSNRCDSSVPGSAVQPVIET